MVKKRLTPGCVGLPQISEKVPVGGWVTRDQAEVRCNRRRRVDQNK
jgi:hypothetical protein